MQHVPGYTGHVPGVLSENIFSKSYARCTATAISKKHPKGYDVTPKVRYLSQSRQEFHANNNRRFGKIKKCIIMVFVVDNPLLKPQKDYNDYTKFVNEEMNVQRDNLVSQSLQLQSQRGPNNSALNSFRTSTISTYKYKHLLINNRLQ